MPQHRCDLPCPTITLRSGKWGTWPVYMGKRGRSFRTAWAASPGFFGRTFECQIRILLHEAIHIRLQCGRLQRNHQAVRESWHHPNVTLFVNINETPNFESLIDRKNLATETLFFAQEVGVDKFIAARYASVVSDYFEERATRFYSNGENSAYDDARTPALAPFRTFYRCLRAEVGLAMPLSQDVRRDLDAARQESEARLYDQAGDELRAWFTVQRRKLLAVSVDSDEPDPDSYTDLFDRVINLPV